ncbi:hypothetical protein BDV98DRAFT_605919 [Pterulicium gracile]|uniref:Uncharacterized protein n=1 Tax=Pterulicium gracile TaxID=1884261 RepID=A0A5C3QCJ3_9AGAR|nr:hypothetical protein BDV98DRAFT_605919 [Pterula gracilis]
MLFNLMKGRLAWLVILPVLCNAAALSAPAGYSGKVAEDRRETAPAFLGTLVAHQLDKLERHAAQDYTSASWIWTTEALAEVTRPFRNVYISSDGRAARFAV